MRKHMWNATRIMVKLMRADPEDYMGIVDELRMQVGLCQVAESSECQAKTFEFHSINQAVTLEFSKQTNADLAEMERMYLEGKRTLMVVSQRMES